MDIISDQVKDFVSDENIVFIEEGENDDLKIELIKVEWLCEWTRSGFRFWQKIVC